MATLIAINGAPGSGKTTLMKWLEPELKIPGLAKDDVKEFLFDRLGYHDRDWSRVLGRASVEALYLVAREFLAANEHLIVENAFWPEVAVPAFEEILNDTEADFIEVYCVTDEETRLKRFEKRLKNSERHPGHVDNLATLSDATDYATLGIGETIPFDTTNPTDSDRQELLSALKSRLEKNRG